MLMADDGPGMPEGVRPGLGLNLIDILTKQLEGEARWDTPGSGTRLTLEFPVRVS
jgi:two-component sensor histidine kinase